MKTPERFNRAIKALVQAFFNDTLAKYNCSACAVGNMVAAGMGIKVSMKDNVRAINAQWACVFQGEQRRICKSFTEFIKHKELRTGVLFDDDEKEILRDRYAQGIENIKSTGYSVEDLYKIELAFESNTYIKYDYYTECSKSRIMLDQYNGLMAVVEVLCEIEGLNSEGYKEAFAYTEDLKPVHSI